ncbi:MAG TPA: cysteine desulfurase NifS [Clostridia bacterium]|jgi:cysteine desulfurase|nr:MAG: Cysteine desulfurase [Firmicutes bacterium ADurb.Bin146]HOD93571.1 cysteine desulfurase NifS [Clostridia bacterium]
MKKIYLDHAATTQLDQNVLEKMMPYMRNYYGNPSSIYTLGRENKKAIEDSREKIASCFNCKSSEIYFTSCGTESDNWAIKGICSFNKNKGMHIITTNIEHHAVLDTYLYMKKQGFNITIVPVEKNGIIDPAKIEKEIRKDTILISVMFANNEIGTIQPIAQIGAIAKKHSVIFHTDAVQAAGSVEIDVQKMNIDLMSISAHKFYGPKGVGALYIRRGIMIDNLFHGGGQEKTRRAATENISGIVGMAEALKLSVDNMQIYNKHIRTIRDAVKKGIEEKIPYIIFNGDADERLVNNINFCFRFIEGESLILMLDFKGISASSGSACTSGSLDPSHVLLALGLPHEVAHGSLRLTFGRDNSIDDVDYIVDNVAEVVEKLRQMSPLFETFLKEKS